MKKPKQRNILSVIFFTVFLNSAGITLIIPVLAMMFLSEQDLVFGAEMGFATKMMALGLLKAAYPVFQFFGAPVLGSLSDRFEIGRAHV